MPRKSGARVLVVVAGVGATYSWRSCAGGGMVVALAARICRVLLDPLCSVRFIDLA